MFAAKRHPLLVPHDGSFDIRKARTGPGKPKDDWKELLGDEVQLLGESQYRLYADGRHAVLLVFQALDAAGKDSTIRHVFAGVNPCGLDVASFKEPSKQELAHDFLWRTTKHLPERGSVVIFNRSYYEEVLVVRVHPELLAAQKLPEKPSKTFWADRLRAIADYERHLAEQGTVILKFWFNMSKAEQRKQLLERIEDPEKQWKFNARDLDERALRDEVPPRLRAVLACDVAAVGAVVCRAGRQQALPSLAGREARQRGVATARRRFPARRQGTARGVEEVESAAARRARLSAFSIAPAARRAAARAPRAARACP